MEGQVLHDMMLFSAFNVKVSSYLVKYYEEGFFSVFYFIFNIPCVYSALHLKECSSLL
jgi:hypothetical protein